MRRQRAAAKELRALGDASRAAARRCGFSTAATALRHRRHDQRVAAEGHGARGADDGRGRRRCSPRARAPPRGRGGGAAKKAAAPQDGGKSQGGATRVGASDL